MQRQAIASPTACPYPGCSLNWPLGYEVVEFRLALSENLERRDLECMDSRRSYVRFLDCKHLCTYLWSGKRWFLSNVLQTCIMIAREFGEKMVGRRLEAVHNSNTMA